MLPVLVCETAAGAATAARRKLKNGILRSQPNDGLRRIDASPAEESGTVITRPAEFVKSTDDRVDCGPRCNSLPLYPRDPMRPQTGFLRAFLATLGLVAAGSAAAQRSAVNRTIDSL